MNKFIIKCMYLLLFVPVADSTGMVDPLDRFLG